jgi:hypothetical protein
VTSDSLGQGTKKNSPTPRIGVDVLAWSAGVVSAGVLGGIILSPSIPLGLVGEWVWNRSPAPPIDPAAWLLPLLASLIYASLLLVGDRFVEAGGSLVRCLLLATLLPVAFFWQRSVADLPSPPLGMERWIPALFFESTSGYFAEAKKVEDTSAFIRSYQEWVARGDSFHQGTHPPGLILIFRGLLWGAARYPEWGPTLEAYLPARMVDGLEAVGQPLEAADRAALLASATLCWGWTLLSALLLYGLIRSSYSARVAWWGACFWPIMPASVLFLPLADAAFAPLTLLVLMWTVYAFRWRVGLLAVLAGGGLCLGTLLSLAFFVTLAIATTWIGWETVSTGRYRRGLITLACLLAGWALPLEWLYENYRLSMIDVWQINLSKHAGFYEAMPRSYLPWLGLNLAEFAAMVSPPLFVLACGRAIQGCWRLGPTSLDRLVVVWFVALLALDWAGRNRSETARLWLFLMPMTAAAAATWGDSRPGWPTTIGRVVLTFLTMAGTLLLVGWVEPLLPVALSP